MNHAIIGLDEKGDEVFIMSCAMACIVTHSVRRRQYDLCSESWCAAQCCAHSLRGCSWQMWRFRGLKLGQSHHGSPRMTVLLGLSSSSGRTLTREPAYAISQDCGDRKCGKVNWDDERLTLRLDMGCRSNRKRVTTTDYQGIESVVVWIR